MIHLETKNYITEFSSQCEKSFMLMKMPNLRNWHECVTFQQSAFGRSTAGNDVVAPISISLFLFPPYFGASVRRSSGRRSGGRLLAMT